MTMLTFPVERTQHDQDQDVYSLASGLDTSDLPDRARQEMKADTDVNTILSRFGIGSLQHQVSFGEVDFTLDLQQALAAVRSAETAYNALPEHVRAKYPDWLRVINAINNRELDTLEQPPTPPPPA